MTLAPFARTPAAARGPAWRSPVRRDSTPGRALASRGSSPPRAMPPPLGARETAAGIPSTRTSTVLGAVFGVGPASGPPPVPPPPLMSARARLRGRQGGPGGPGQHRCIAPGRARLVVFLFDVDGPDVV